MNRAEIEKAVEPIIRRSLRELEYTPEDVPDADFAVHTDGMFRPDVRRVSMILSMALSVVAADICKEPLPFADGQFLVVTFSEVLEHLPVERVSFVFSELARVIRPKGVLLVSSPNQASLECRVRLLRGKSILAMPDIDPAIGVFGHIRLYTPAEIKSALRRLGFTLERSRIETNISGYRGKSPKSWRRRMYRLYERLEGRLGMLRSLGDTWFMAFRKEV